MYEIISRNDTKDEGGMVGSKVCVDHLTAFVASESSRAVHVVDQRVRDQGY